MKKELPFGAMAGPALFFLAVYSGWVLGRFYFCGIAI